MEQTKNLLDLRLTCNTYICEIANKYTKYKKNQDAFFENLLCASLSRNDKFITMLREANALKKNNSLIEIIEERIPTKKICEDFDKLIDVYQINQRNIKFFLQKIPEDRIRQIFCGKDIDFQKILNAVKCEYCLNIIEDIELEAEKDEKVRLIDIYTIAYKELSKYKYFKNGILFERLEQNLGQERWEMFRAGGKFEKCKLIDRRIFILQIIISKASIETSLLGIEEIVDLLVKDIINSATQKYQIREDTVRADIQKIKISLQELESEGLHG